MSRSLALLLLLFLLSPFLILGLHISDLARPDFEEIWWALKNTLLQAAGSTILAVVIGMFLVSGLAKLLFFRSGIVRFFLEGLCLLPSFLPPLFSILIFLSVVDPFPMGIPGIILIQGGLYAGLFAVSWLRLLQDKASVMIDTGWVLGASRWRLLVESLLFLRKDFFTLLLLLFSICFTSFSIPIAVGGGRGTTLEVLIYEKIRLSGDWGQAYALSLFQTFFMVIFFLFLQRRIPLSSVGRAIKRPLSLEVVGSWGGAGALILFIFFWFGSFLWQIFSEMDQVGRIPGLWGTVGEALPATVGLALAVGFLCWGLLSLLVFCREQLWLRQFFRGYLAPSTALVGFAGVILGAAGFSSLFMLFVAGFTILVIAGLYRLGFDQALTGVDSQAQVARLFGASPRLIFFKITWPQLLPSIGWLSATAAFWAAGDFAFAKMVFTTDATVALVIEGLMNSYRIGAATVILGLLLLLGICIYMAFIGFGYVIGRKFN